MNKIQAIKVLRDWRKRARYIFTTHTLSQLFSEDSPKTLSEALNRLVKADLIERVCRNVYVNHDGLDSDRYLIEKIAKVLRPGCYNYVSLESMLSEYGVISQIPIDRLTVMTTGRKGLYKTSYGVIEFTHTKRSVVDILNHTDITNNRPLRIATKATAWRDLKRVGRNVNLVNEQELHDD